MPDVALVTEARFESPARVDAYVQNILDEDRMVTDALAAHGLTTHRVDWARADVDWSAYRCAVVRTTWDYFERPAAFRAWVARVAERTRLFNCAETLLWNADKRYLLELAARGIAIPPTHVLERGSEASLAQVMASTGWDEVVVKPVVSGGGRETYRVDAAGLAQHEPVLAALLRNEAMMVQPFFADVIERGEVTVVVIGGEPTHALLKRAKPGEFRVQDDHGGTVHAYTATAPELALARRAIAACTWAPLYGRVDMVADARGEPVMMELELIEPELWFRLCPAAATRFAAALAVALRD